MIANDCVHSAALLEALASGCWPDSSPAELQEHVVSCEVCADLLVVAEALLEDRRESQPVTGLRPSGAVWWRMQMRERAEGNARAARTVQRAHGAIIVATLVAAVCVLAVTSLATTVWTWFRSLSAAMPALPDVPAITITPALMVVASGSLAALAFVALFLAVARD
jgi:hypothetical protein